MKLKDALVGGLILGVINGVIISALNLKDQVNSQEIYSVKTTQAYNQDINKDGLEDVIQNDGTILVKQSDGGFKTLKEVVENTNLVLTNSYQTALKIVEDRYVIEKTQINKKYQSDREILNKKYTLHQEQVRNSFDNLNYKIKTGRYVLGE